MPLIVAPKLTAGDRVRLVSPASTPSRGDVDRMVANLARIGLRPELGEHVFDEYGYLAGRDDHRLADINDAFRDPGVRAIIATRGGKGAYRIADRLDFAAARQDPKLLVGFSEITILHLALLNEIGLAGLHGACWDADVHGHASASSFERAVLTTDHVRICSDPLEPTAALTTAGRASGPLIGGNQDMLAISSGWALPNLDGAILLLEAFNLRLGHIDRQLTMLANSGALQGIAGVAVGQYTKCGTDDSTRGNWTEIDVLRDRLAELQVPVLGGLPIGHGDNPQAVPIGTPATLDATAGVLHVAPAVC